MFHKRVSRLDNMARHETRTGVCFPGTGIARRREPECRAPMFGSKLKHRKENRHHEKLHTPPARTCPEPNHHCPCREQNVRPESESESVGPISLAFKRSLWFGFQLDQLAPEPFQITVPIELHTPIAWLTRLIPAVNTFMLIL